MKKILRKILYIFFPRLTKGASILMYHSVAKNKAFFTVSPEDFEKQMEYLSQSGLKIIPLSLLLDMFFRKEDLSTFVCVTFDDGYLDNLENALPVLRKYNIKTTIFIAPKLLGSKFTTSDGVTLDIFSQEDFKKYDGFTNFEFLPHSFSHKELTRLSMEEIREELSESIGYLNNICESRKILAYPRGKYSKTVIEVLQSEGWESGVTTLPGLTLLDTEKFLIPRNFVGRDVGLLEFKTIVSDAVYYYAKIRLCFTDLFKKS